MKEFEKMGIDEDFGPVLKEMKIREPSEVQNEVIPAIMKGNSVLAVAQTGTGKTLSFALPLSELVKRIEDEQGPTRKKSQPYIIVVAPTKELANQIHQVFKAISHHVKLRVRTLISTQTLKKALPTQSYEILLATPTKLSRAIKKGEVKLDQLQHLVFDEADNLFEMGFKKDIETILYPVKYDDTQIHFFSATMPIEVETYLNTKFKKKSLKKIVLDSSHKVQQRIDTYNIHMKIAEKHQMLNLFIKKTMKGRGIIFCNQKNQVEELDKYIKEKFPELKYRVLHGNLSEKERLASYKSFVDKKAQVLIATDVAARGIDVRDLAWVLNFYLPKTAIYYLHRGGRTARGKRSGLVYNFVTSSDAKIISAINESIRSQSHMNIDTIVKSVPKKVSSKEGKKVAKKKQKRVKITKRTRQH